LTFVLGPFLIDGSRCGEKIHEIMDRPEIIACNGVTDLS